MVYSVRFFAISRVPSTKKGGEDSFRFRWMPQGRKRPCSRNFATEPAAESFRAELLTARNAGEPFDLDTGLPMSMLRRESDAEAQQATRTHLELAREYAAMKWPDLSGKSRETTANALTAVTIALVSDRPRRPADDDLWSVLYTYAFVPAAWPDEERPKRVLAPAGPAALTSAQRLALGWLSKASIPVDELAKAKVTRQAVDALKVTRDGGSASDVYFRRRRGVLSNYISYLIENDALDANPLDKLKKTEKRIPKAVVPVEPEVAFSPAQGIELLIALTYVGSYKRARGRRLVVFFALVMFGGLRPEEALGLVRRDCTLPRGEWGSVKARRTKPNAGKRWTDTGEIHDDRGLKGRDDTEVRTVPIPPVLVDIILAHLEEFGAAADGRIVSNERGGVPVASTLSRAWKEARPFALTPEQVNSPLADTPYTGRHAALSTQLSAGVDPADVARRAGNSIEVLLRIYAKFITGRDEINNRKIDQVLTGISYGKAERSGGEPGPE
jgi:integrase